MVTGTLSTFSADDLKMKLAFSTNAYLNHTIEESLRRVADIGYTGVELMADVPHAWPAGLLPSQVESIRKTLDETGLEISNINAFMMNAVADPRQPYWHPSWIDPDPHYRAIRREHTKRSLQLAVDLQAPHITTEPGGPLFEGQTRKQAYDCFYEELMPCVEMAETLNMGLLIEPEPELLIEKFDEYLEFMDRIDSIQVGLNFDIGHAYCVKEEPAEWIPKMQSHTIHYHLEDIAETRKHQHLIPGHGAIDFTATLKAIVDTNYLGWLTVELYPYATDPDVAARESFEYLSNVLSSLN